MSKKYTSKISTDDFQNNEYILDTSKVETIYFQHDDEITYSVKGSISGGEIWSTINLINVSDYSTVSTVNTEGLYLADVSNLDIVKIILTSAAEGSELYLKVVGDLW